MSPHLTANFTRFKANVYPCLNPAGGNKKIKIEITSQGTLLSKGSKVYFVKLLK